jgi:hypothetical protein
MCNGRATPGGVVSHNKIIAPILEVQAKIHEAAPVTFLSTPDWDPLTALTLSWQPASDVLRAYFTGTDKFIYEFAGTNASSTAFPRSNRDGVAQNSTSGVSTPGWAEAPTHDLTWIPSASVAEEVTSVAWLDQVNFYRYVNGQIVESSLAQGAWSARFI